MNKSLFLKLRQLNYVNCYYRFSNVKKFSTLISDYPSNNKLVSFSHYLNRKRRYFRRVDDALHKKFSALAKSNSSFNEPALYLLPQFIVSRGMKDDSSNGSNFNDSLSHLFTPVKFEATDIEEGVGVDIVGPLNKEKVLSIINKFYTDTAVKDLAREQGLDQYLFQQTIISFRKYCLDTEKLPTELHVILNDIIKKSIHLHELYPYFYKHAKDIFPHLSCMDDLYKVSDLTQPPNWYPEARAMNRKIIFHAGPTNSGKTYHAMEQFMSSQSGVYCGPLKLLAVEVHEKCNNLGTPCDLVTGEERKFAVGEDLPASHVSCTVEMTSINAKYEIAIIDEIQMVKDPLRGWAWTRAFLGICADEVHVCGEASAIDIIKELAMSVGEDLEVRRYKRLTPLTVEKKALFSLDQIQPGDCIVCFSRQVIHRISQAIEVLGHEVAVIYGGLPPGAKLAQAKKFNDPDHPCKIMVATDAIGMGLNLSIRRVVFSTLVKPHVNEKGEKEMETISVSSALQIAGRAGRYGTKYSEGFVTTLKNFDLPVLQKLLESSPPDIEQAGLHPTADQIELFAFHLPTYTLSNLVDIFVKLCTVDSSLYFMCIMDDFKFLADLIQHTPLPLRARYVFCCAPINKKMPFVCSLFLKFAKQFSQGEPVTFHWICRQVNWPFTMAATITDLVHQEEVFDTLDLYLWLSYRFPDMFPDAEMVRGLQQELDAVIQLGVAHITQLKSSEMEKTKAAKRLALLLETEDTNNVTEPSRKTLKFLNQARLRKKDQSLAESLVKKGIISQEMLRELKSEIKKSLTQNDFTDDDAPSPRNTKKKRR